jgi:hypothetical protein
MATRRCILRRRAGVGGGQGGGGGEGEGGSEAQGGGGGEGDGRREGQGGGGGEGGHPPCQWRWPSVERCRVKKPRYTSVYACISLPSACKTSAHGTVRSPAAWLPSLHARAGIYPPRDRVPVPGHNSVPVPAFCSAIGVTGRIRRVAAERRGNDCAVPVSLRVRDWLPGPQRPLSACLPVQGGRSGPAQPRSLCSSSGLCRRGSQRCEPAQLESRSEILSCHLLVRFTPPLGWRRPRPAFAPKGGVD